MKTPSQKIAKEIFDQMREDEKQNFVKKEWRESIGNMTLDLCEEGLLDVDTILDELEGRCFPSRRI